MSQKPILELHHISKQYVMGEAILDALKDVNLSICANEYVAFIGPSGSGKSTLMNIVGCLDKPSSGEYLLNGTPVAQLDDNALARIRNREIGFIFQNFNLLGRANALHNVNAAADLPRVSFSERRQLATQALQSVGLGDRLQHLPTNCPAASASGWPSPAPWLANLRSCWPTNQRATWIPVPAAMSWRCSTNCTKTATR